MPWPAGRTCIVQLTGELGPPPERVLNLWGLDELRGIAVRGDSLELGPLTTYAELRRSPACRGHVPALVDAAATIGAAQIQNRGTIGGNVMNASPAGDTLPVLLALDAVLVLGGATGEREVAAIDFWPAYRRTAARPDELLVRIRVPLAADREQRFRKVGTRRAQAISKVVVAAAWRGRGPVAGRADRHRLGRAHAHPGRGRGGRARGPSPDPGHRSRPPSRRSGTRSSRSTTSARRPPTGARPRAVSSAACWPMPQGSRTRRAREVRRDRARGQPVRQAVDPPRARGPWARPPRPRPDRGRLAGGRVRGGLHGRRQLVRRRDRHDEEHGVRARAGAPDRGHRGLRDGARQPLPGGGAGRACDDHDPRARVGATRDAEPARRPMRSGAPAGRRGPRSSRPMRAASPWTAGSRTW